MAILPILFNGVTQVHSNGAFRVQNAKQIGIAEHSLQVIKKSIFLLSYYK